MCRYMSNIYEKWCRNQTSIRNKPVFYWYLTLIGQTLLILTSALKQGKKTCLFLRNTHSQENLDWQTLFFITFNIYWHIGKGQNPLTVKDNPPGAAYAEPLQWCSLILATKSRGIPSSHPHCSTSER